ncbi:MAG: MFS transporter [Lactobacillus sp.]|nr:MFS transporter [Lactobacillus sp.]MCI2034153.1 MFS transporter [Lactobacillus sp.]
MRLSKSVQVALLMAASLFMEIMDGTIVTTALPSVARALRVSPLTAAMMISIYLITVAVCIPLSGWISTRLGKRRTWLLAVAGFTLTSIGTALAVNFAMLLVMRVLQGVFGSLMTPTARLIVLEKTAPKDLLVMTSYLVWPALLAPAIAPPLGGAILAVLDWRWLFLINIPFGVVSYLIGLHLIDTDQPSASRHFDWRGFIGLAIVSAALLGGVEVGTHGVAWLGLAGILVAMGAVCAVLVVRHLLFAKKPLIALGALKQLSFRVTQTGGSVLWLSVGAMPYLLTVDLQRNFGWSALKAGGFVLWIFVGNIGIKPFTTPLIRHYGYKATLIASDVVIAMTACGFAMVTVTTAAAIIAGLALFSGAARSMALSAYNGLTFADLTPKHRGDANTLNAVTSTMAQGLGVSLVTIVLAGLSAAMSQTQAYAGCFIFLGVLMVYPLVETWLLPRDIGAATI